MLWKSLLRSLLRSLALGLVAWLALAGCTGSDGPGAVPEAARPESREDLEPLLLELIDEHVATVEADPADASAHGTLGLVYEANELWALAHRSYANAAVLDPSDPVWLYRAARAEERTGSSDGAFAKYTDLATRFPRFAPARHRLGLRLLERGDLDGADRELRAALALRRSLPEPHAALAELCSIQGRFDEALAHAERAVELDGDYARARYVRGVALRGAGRPDDASADLSAGLNATTRSLPDRLTGRTAQFLVGMSVQSEVAAHLIETGRYDEAITLLRRALVDRPGDLVLGNNLSVAYQRNGQPQEAREILEKSVEAHPNHLPTLLNLAETYWKLRLHDEELRIARRAVQVDPHSGPAHFALAKAHLMLGNAREGVAAAEEALRYDTENPEIHSAAGEGLLQLSEFERAEEHFRKAMAIEPRLLPARVNLAMLLIQDGRLDEAAVEIRGLVEIAPRHPMVLRAQERYATAARAARGGGSGSSAGNDGGGGR